MDENGHTFIAHSLLTTELNVATLRYFFGDLPINEWFNLSAPRIKNGEISPDDFDENTALDAMVEEPLLIRRPLIEAEGELACGFDNALVRKLLGEDTDVSNLQTCPNTAQWNNCD